MDRLVRTAVGLFVWITIARYLGPNNFGVLNYSVALVSLFGTVSTLGLNRIVIRELVNKPSNSGIILGTVTLIRTISSIAILGCAIYATTYLSAKDPRTPLLVSIIGLSLIFQTLDTIDLWYQSQVQSKYTVIAKSASFFVCALFKLYLVIVNAPLITFAIVISAEILIASFGLIVIYLRKYSFTHWKFKLSTATSLLKESWPEAIAGISTLLFMRVDQIMLGELINSEAVGQYSAASRITEVLYFIPMIIISSTFPMIISSSNKKANYHTQLKRLFTLLALISYVIAILCTFFSDEIIQILYGAQYTEAANVLMIHAWTLLIVSFGLVSGSWIINEKRTKLSMKRAMLGAISNIILNFLLIPRYGLTGAATGTLISQFIAYYLFDFFSPSMSSVRKMKTRAFLILDYRTLLPNYTKSISI